MAHPDHSRETFYARLRASMTGEERTNMAARDKRLKQVEEDAVNQLCEELLGIRPEHGDTIYGQHPLMAGVVRPAVRQAFNAGVGAVASEILNSAMDRSG